MSGPAPVRLPVPDTPPEPPYVGFIEKIGAGTITGWAAKTSALSTPVRVLLYLDDALVAEGVADTERFDVRDAGFGDGLHGFELRVPKKALFCATRLFLKAEDGTPIAERLLREDGPARGPVLWMDASDLVEFLTHHRELSGIQRVQAGYLLGLGQATIGGVAVRICARFKNSIFYYEVPYDRFTAILRDAGNPASVRPGRWTAYVADIKTSFTTRASLHPGDTMFTLGAPWALDDHNELIRCAKLVYGIRYWQIFYDLIPISMPEVVAAPLIPHFARAMAAMTIYADHVFSISRYSMEDLARTLRGIGRPVPSISVIPMGGTIDDAEKGADRAPVKAALLVDGPFVLCVGTLEPRKNHMLLYQIWRRLVAEHGAEAVPKLVLVGRVGWYMEDFMRMLKVSANVDGRIVHLTAISNTDLAALYDACLFTVFPSVSEGWGLPITESLARGKVCVCSNLTSMPEAGEEHAVYIDPYDLPESHDVIEKLIFSEGVLAERETTLRAGFKAVTWDDASKTMERMIAGLLAPPPPAAAHKPIQLGRVYKFYNIEVAEPDATATKVFSNFLDQEDALDLLVGNAWYEFDLDCTWSCGDACQLRLPIPADTSGDLVVYIEVVVPLALTKEAFEVLVDGNLVERFRTVRRQQLVLNLPLTELRDRVVTFRSIGTRQQTRDDRPLGIGIATVAVFANTDLVGRLAFFERKLLSIAEQTPL